MPKTDQTPSTTRAPAAKNPRAKPKRPAMPRGTAASQPAKPPPLPNDSIGEVTGWHAQLFAERDIYAIWGAAGMTIAPDQLSAAPEILRTAFDESLSWLEVPKLHSPPSIRRNWLLEVHKRAEALLSVLHFPTGAKTIREYDLIFPWEGGQYQRRTAPNLLLSESFHADLPKHFSLLPEQVREVFKHYPGQTENDGWDTLRPGTTSAALDMAPWVIALVSEIGRQGAEHWGRSTGQNGRGKEAFSRALFMNLANSYEKLTGKAPSGLQGSGADAGKIDPDAAPILWVRGILNIAAERLLKVTSGYENDAVEAIRKAATLSDTRIARLFSPSSNTKDLEKT